MAIPISAGFLTLPTVIDWASLASIVAVASIFMYIVLVYFKGMEKPPFWLYFVFGFIIVAFHGILLNIQQINQQVLYLSIVRLVGSLLMLYGVLQLLRSYASKIRFDKRLGKK